MKQSILILLLLIVFSSCKVTKYELSNSSINEIYELTYHQGIEKDVLKYDIIVPDSVEPYKWRLVSNKLRGYLSEDCQYDNLYAGLEKTGKMPKSFSKFVEQYSFPYSQFELTIKFSNIFYCEATKTAIVALVLESKDKNGSNAGGFSRSLYLFRQNKNKWEFVDAQHISAS